MFRNYLKSYLRNLWKNRTYSTLNIVGLAVGIACSTLIFLWVEDEFTFDHQFEKKKYLYQVMENQTYDGNTYTFSATPGPLSAGIKTDMPGVAATSQNLVVLLSKEFLYLVLVSLVIAIPVTWLVMHNWLQDFAYRISIEWWVFLLGGTLALLIALATVGFQALRAATANPAKSLRTE
jgi:ABC-type antimicrobial peptide transport system permease subunit